MSPTVGIANEASEDVIEAVIFERYPAGVGEQLLDREASPVGILAVFRSHCFFSPVLIVQFSRG